MLSPAFPIFNVIYTNNLNAGIEVKHLPNYPVARLYSMRALLVHSLVSILFFAASCSASPQASFDRAISSCARHSTWHPDSFGREAPRCIHVYTTMENILQIKRAVDPSAFAHAAWIWLDDASSCVFAARQGLTNALGRVMLERVIWHHKQILSIAIASDSTPLQLPQETCAPFVASSGSLKMFHVQGIKVHSKVGVKYFEMKGSALQNQSYVAAVKIRGLYARSNLSIGAHCESILFSCLSSSSHSFVLKALAFCAFLLHPSCTARR
jgi:hypothetical protein